MRLAITGTPGTGKSAVAEVLAERGWRVLELNAYAKEKGLLGREDKKRSTREIDTEKLKRVLAEENLPDKAVLVGHLSHLVGADLIILLRCRPSVLEERLRRRKYSKVKVRENMEAEACDVILIEAMETGVRVFEIDTTERTPEQVADAIDEILAGEKEKYEPGHIDWSEEVLGWY